MITDDILNYAVADHIFNIPPQEIIFSGYWITGDYSPPINNCSCDDFYHDCGSRIDNFHYVLETARIDDYYSLLLGIIKLNGFKSPLSAIIAHDYESIILVDGHHRLAIACDLQMETIPVFIAGPGTHIEDVIAPDSKNWKQGNISYPILLDKLEMIR